MDDIARQDDKADDLALDLLFNPARGGVSGRRAHRLVHFIEEDVRYRKDQIRWACRVLLGLDESPWKARDLLSGFAVRSGKSSAIDPKDLERHALLWSRIVPDSPEMRATVMHILGEKYRFVYAEILNIRRALLLDSDEVRAAYLRAYGTPIETLFATGKACGKPPECPADSTEQLLAMHAEWRFVAGEEAVTRRGEPIDHLYVVVSGRLRTEPSPDVLGVPLEYGPGDVLGDATILVGAAWKYTVYAARDSEVVSVPRDAVTRLLDSHPRQGLQLSQALIKRSTATSHKHQPSTLTIAAIPLDKDVDFPRFAERLASAMAVKGPTLRIDRRLVDDSVTAGASDAKPGDDLDGLVASWLSEKEANHRFVLYQADYEPSDWTDRCIRQADCVLLVAQAGTDPAIRPVEKRLNPRADVHLALLHPDAVERPSGTASWLAHRRPRLHHHVRLGVQEDMHRLARLLCGAAVTLVLGGGGARGFAHAGVLRALTEQGIQPDAVGGTSMGAVAAGLTALGWPPQDILNLGKRLTKQSLFDYTLPFVSLTAGRRLNAFLQSIFGEARIEDLWRPYYCVSTNLTKGGTVIHRTGPLWEAVRASTAIPGIFGPVIHNGEVLVDGAVLDNLPIRAMRGLCRSETVIAVRVGAPGGGFGTYRDPATLSGWQILWRRLSPLQEDPDVPSILTLLLRSVEVKDSISRGQPEPDEEADLLIQANTESVRLLDFSAYQILEEIGYRAASEALERHGCHRRTEDV